MNLEQGNSIGPIALFGSGETSPAAQRIHHEVMSRLPKPVRAARLASLLETDPSRAAEVPKIEVSPLVSGPEKLEEGIPEGMRILLAEDNPFNQRVAAGMLKKLGCQVSLVVDGSQALDLLRKEEFDLIFMDCQMPEMDGYEASRRIREFPGAVAGIPIIALTANAFREDRDACLAAGMDDFMTKPVKLDQLELTLAKWSKVQSSGERQPS